MILICTAASNHGFVQFGASEVLDFKEFAKIIRNKFAEQDPLAAMLTT